MFGYFKRKEFILNCPLCEKEYRFKYNPEEMRVFKYPFKEGTGVVFTLECDFCGCYGKILQYPTGEVETFDHTWGKSVKEHTDSIREAEEKLSGIKEQLEKSPEDRSLVSKRAQAERVLQKLKSNFKKDAGKYEELKNYKRDLWRKTLENMDKNK